MNTSVRLEAFKCLAGCSGVEAAIERDLARSDVRGGPAPRSCQLTGG
jgi:hypothetical protein